MFCRLLFHPSWNFFNCFVCKSFSFLRHAFHMMVAEILAINWLQTAKKRKIKYIKKFIPSTLPVCVQHRKKIETNSLKLLDCSAQTVYYWYTSVTKTHNSWYLILVRRKYAPKDWILLIHVTVVCVRVCVNAYRCSSGTFSWRSPQANWNVNALSRLRATPSNL